MARIRPRALSALVTVALLVIAVQLSIRIGGSSSRYIVIHTDDAGLCPAVNAATIDAMERGVVSSASIMTCCPGFDEFAAYAVVHPERDFGVHLTLTSELNTFRWGPVLSARDVPSLVDENGHFWRSVAQVAEHAELDDVERELRGQIDRAIAAGIRVSHLDHHMWVLYSRPDLIDLYVQLGITYDIPVRFCTVAPQDQIIDRGPTMIAAYNAQRAVLEAQGMPVFDFVETGNYDIQPEDKRDYYLTHLRRIPPGVSEFVIHCAYDVPGAMKPHAASYRQADTRVFMSLEIEDEIRKLGLHVIDWSQFRLMNQRRESPGSARQSSLGMRLGFPIASMANKIDTSASGSAGTPLQQPQFLIRPNRSHPKTRSWSSFPPQLKDRLCTSEGFGSSSKTHPETRLWAKSTLENESGFEPTEGFTATSSSEATATCATFMTHERITESR